jgi:N-acetylneuraminic acid mutarotase
VSPHALRPEGILWKVIAVLLAMLPFGAVQAAAPANWSRTGSMTTSRVLHTATLLPSGEVLVAGGQDESSGGPVFYASAELYDPKHGSWSPTKGALTVARSGHTATALVGGKVLVAGGTNVCCSSALASAELYDPLAGTWATTGSMAESRYQPAAARLNNGKVLVAGGTDGLNILASAELYDPAAGSWSTAGSMLVARWEPTATLLADGRVLVVGGYNGGPLATAELYDPTTNSWSAAASTHDPRYKHTATRLDNGRVLVVGGSFISSNSNALASAELYDPLTNAWSVTGSLADARSSHSATLLPGGKVLVAGGVNTFSFASTELFDPASGGWRPTGSMSAARQNHTATLLNTGRVLVAGGFSGGAVTASAELYRPARR